MIIQPASLEDAQAISHLVNTGEREGQLLPRTLDAIRGNIRDWMVAKENGRVVGCGSLVEMSPVLSEVRSLVVDPACRKNGVGGKIVKALILLAQAREIPTVFALTRAVPFFEKLGFVTTAKENFPEKVWGDCAICPVRNACDEVAVVHSVDVGQWVVVNVEPVEKTELQASFGD